MGLNETVKQMRDLLGSICADIEKAVNGNKAASQRVRTATIKMEKVAKKYRKESIHAEKQGGSKKAKKAAPKKAAAKKPAAKKAAPKAKAAKVKAKPKAKAVARRPAMAMKRPTAKLPVRR